MRERKRNDWKSQDGHSRPLRVCMSSRKPNTKRGTTQPSTTDTGASTLPRATGLRAAQHTKCSYGEAGQRHSRMAP